MRPRDRFEESRRRMLHLVGQDAEPTAAEAEQAELEQERELVREEAREHLGLSPSAPFEAIQAAFADDLWEFWLFFFPEFRRDDAGRETPPASFHEEFCREIQALVEGPAATELARAYPREHAKSIFATLVTPIWATANKKRRFPFLFSDTDTQAWGFLEDIRLEVETNDRLRAIYPDFCEWDSKPRNNRLVFGNGTLMMAAGSSKSVRGARKGRQRPDFIILDDIENDQEVENPARRRQKMRWYNKVVRKLGAASVYLIVGTILHAESFLAKRIKNPDADVFAALIAEPARQDLWKIWEDIFLEGSNPNRENDARAYYDSKRTAMDSGAAVLWPERVSLYQLMSEKAEDLASFLSERQNNPFDPTASWFPEDRLLFLEKDDMPNPELAKISVLFWDPSRGTSKSDTSSTLRLDCYPDGRRIVSQAVTDRIPPEEVMDVIIGWHKQRQFTAIGVEKVALSSYDETLRTRSLAAGLMLPIIPVTPKGDKNLRIKSLRPSIVAQLIQFSAALPLDSIRQIKFYPQHPNDDFPDALEQANKLADEYLQDVPAAGATAEAPHDHLRIEHEGMSERMGVRPNIDDRFRGGV